jgi:hypothetical protein
MGAVKEMIGELGAAGFVPVDAAMLTRWQRATGTKIKTERVTVEVRGRTVAERGLPAAEARRLAADARLAPEDREHLAWIMRVAGVTAAGCCPRCGSDNVTWAVEATMMDGRLVVRDADEPEGPAFPAVARCEECDEMVPVAAPVWTAKHRHDALAAFNGPRLRNALAALHRAAVEAGVSGQAVEEAARRLRGCEVEPADPLAGYKQRAAERFKRLDALEAKCAWGCDCPTTAQREARERWRKLMDEQGADEVANGL